MVRRAPGSGSISGGPTVWRLVVPAGFDAVTGKRRQVVRSFHGTKTAAQRALADLLVATDATGAQASNVEVRQLLARYMDVAELAPATRSDYDRVISAVLLPRLGDYPLNRVTPPLLDATWRTAQSEGVTLHRLRRAHVILSSAFRYAIRWGWASSNPTRGATPRTPPAAATNPPPSRLVLRDLLAAVEADTDLYVWMRLAIVTGARRGEVLGLRWGDIDTTARQLTIARSITSTAATGTIAKTTKTGKVRRVALDPATVDALERLALERPDAVERNGYVLTYDINGAVPWRPDSASRRFRRIRERIPGAERVRLHDLRHAAATILLAAGYDVRTVADRLGHANPSMTLAVYAATLPESARAAADTMGDLLG